MKMKKLMVAALATAITIGGTLPAYAAWKETGAEWKYQNEDGSYKASTWFEEAGKKYHFDVNGNAQKGWFKEADKWYFFGYNGVMQTGLIKVDDKVYFMNDDGSLFVGTKKIGNTDYNFTEYGTTNGQPSVVESRTWAGNGNQTKNYGNGGGGSSSGNGSSVLPTVKEEVKAKVNEIFAEVKDSVSDSVSVKLTDSNITIDATAEYAEKTVEDTNLIEETQSAIQRLFDENENVQEVIVAGNTYDREKISNINVEASMKKLGFEGKTVNQLLNIIKDNEVFNTIKIKTADDILTYTIK